MSRLAIEQSVWLVKEGDVPVWFTYSDTLAEQADSEGYQVERIEHPSEDIRLSNLTER